MFCKIITSFLLNPRQNILQIKTDTFTLVPKSNTDMGFSGNGKKIFSLTPINSCCAVLSWIHIIQSAERRIDEYVETLTRE